MPRLSRRYGALAQPLDELLGAPARVRVLRALDRVPGPLTAAAVANEAGLTHNAAQQALTRFVEARLVDEAAAGRHRLYRLEDEHPFTAGLRVLFAAERERRRAIQAAAADWADRQPATLRAVWLFGSVARREDTFTSDLDLAVVADGREDARDLANSLLDVLGPVANRQRLSPNVLAYESAEMLALPETDAEMWANLRRDAVALHGPAPVALQRELERRAGQHPELAHRTDALRSGRA
jgi:DNA-binding transcriptional ArsR family regulator